MAKQEGLEHDDQQPAGHAREPRTHRNPDDLVTSHLYLVKHVLHQLAARLPQHADRDELYSAGLAGLVEASRRYDESLGVAFPTFAVRRIRGAMIDATRTVDWASRRLRRTMREVQSRTADLAQENGRTPTSAELAASLGMTVDDLDALRRDAAAANLLHVEQRLAGDERTVGDRIQDRMRENAPEEQLEHRELVGTLRTALRLLPETQRDVLERHFFGGELFRDIAASMGVTEARVSQIRSEALHALRAYLGTNFDGIEPVPAGAPGVRRRSAFVAEVATSSTWRSRLEAAEGAYLTGTSRPA